MASAIDRAFELAKSGQYRSVAEIFPAPGPRRPADPRSAPRPARRPAGADPAVQRRLAGDAV